MNDLLPCPFCGGLKSTPYEESGLTMMACFMCGCYGPAAASRERALQLWNTRTFNAAVQAIPDCGEGVK